MNSELRGETLAGLTNEQQISRAVDMLKSAKRMFQQLSQQWAKSRGQCVEALGGQAAVQLERMELIRYKPAFIDESVREAEQNLEELRKGREQISRDIQQLVKRRKEQQALEYKAKEEEMKRLEAQQQANAEMAKRGMEIGWSLDMPKHIEDNPNIKLPAVLSEEKEQAVANKLADLEESKQKREKVKPPKPSKPKRLRPEPEIPGLELAGDEGNDQGALALVDGTAAGEPADDDDDGKLVRKRKATPKAPGEPRPPRERKGKERTRPREPKKKRPRIGLEEDVMDELFGKESSEEEGVRQED